MMKRTCGIPRRIGASAQRFARRASDQRGFTLVEMLAALAVMMLLTATVTMGMTMGMQTYRESTFASEREILANTIDSALSDPFRSMTTTTTGTTTTYTIVYRGDAATGTVKNPRLVAAGGRLYLQGDNTTGSGIALLNASAYSDCAVTQAQLTTLTSTEVSGTYTIQSTVDTKLSRQYGFTYVPAYPISKT